MIVALFSLPGCAWCEAVRSDQLRHLARDARAQQLRVVEYEITDRHPFAAPDRSADSRDGSASPPSPASPASHASPAALAEALAIRVAPTVVLLGPEGHELAERLVGYPSPDFYGAYLGQRIGKAHERLAER